MSRTVLAIALPLLSLTRVSNAAAPSELTVTYADDRWGVGGLVSMSLDTVSVPVIAGASPDITSLDVWNGTAAVPLAKIDYNYATRVVSTNWDDVTKTRTMQYGWGSMSLRCAAVRVHMQHRIDDVDCTHTLPHESIRPLVLTRSALD